MAKYYIIGSGHSIMDDWGKGSDGTIGYRISGNCVERITEGGSAFTTAALGEPIQTLYWDKTGNIYALTESGKVKCCGSLSPNPNTGYKAVAQEIGGNNNAESAKPKKVRAKKERSYSWAKNLWKWPFKFLWWCIKGLAGILLFGAFLNMTDKNNE